MAINGNTIARIIDRQRMNNREILNVYHYLLTTQDDDPNLVNLGNEFITNVLTPIATTQANDLVHETMRIELVNRGNSELEVATSVPGYETSDDESPTFVTASYKLTRSDTDTRSGRKAISGLVEADIDGNALSPSGLIKFGLLEPVFQTVLTTSDGDWRPIILGKVSSVANGTYFVNFISGVDLRSDVGTQNTRKS